MVQRGLGFILDEETYIFKHPEEKGHIEVALRAIKEAGKQKKYEEQTKWKDPVDFLVYSLGAIKVGNRWKEKVITYCPYLIDSHLQCIIQEYKREQYDVDEVYEPTNNDEVSIFRRFR